MTILAFALVGQVQATPPAFPGAVGFGSTATGGRGDAVVYVTNLNDSGTGSFRTAVGTSGRTVVFQVGGYVQAFSPISFASNLTIAGQTAPGQGFGVFGCEMSFSGANNCIVRHMRFRDGSLDPNWPGTNGTDSHTNCVNLYNTNGMMFDHCSLEFAAYNNVDSTSAVDVTFQNCIVADPIKEQQFNFHLDTGPGTFIGNIFANSHNRSILAKANLQYVNNTVYNYQAGFTTGDSSGVFNYDFINNDFISGPGTTNKNDAYYQVDSNQSAYATGNLINGSASNTIGGANALSTYYFTSANATTPTTSLPIVSATASLINNLDNAGALPRDQVDAQVISQVASGGSSGPGGGLYSTQAGTGLSNSGYGTITGGAAPVYSDTDGIPDYWYSSKNWTLGTNVGATQATDGSGYTNLEEYLNWLAGSNAICQKSASVQIDLSQYTAGLTSPTYTVAAIASGTTISPAGIGGAATTIAGTVTVSGSTATFTPTSGSVGLGGFNFTATGTNGSITNTVYVCVTATTQPTSVTWVGDGSANSWDDTNANNLVWSTGTSNLAWTQGDTATLDDSGSESPAINLANAITAASVTVSTVNSYTLGGTGSLAIATTGNLTVNGYGTGSLTFSNSGTNNIAGPVTITDATVNVNSSASLGTGTLTFDNTTLNVTAANVSLGNSSIAVLTASSLNFPHNGGSDFLPTITGNSPVNISLNGTTVTLNNSVSGFTSTFQINGPGNLRMNNAANWGVPNGVLDITGDAGIDNHSGGACTIPFGSLSGSVGTSLSGSDQGSAAGTLCTYTIGSLSQSTTFAGGITNSTNQTVAITKTGTGTLTLSGTNTYTGATTVSGGTLCLAGTASLGNTAVSLASGCSLLGTGTIGSTSGGAVTMASGSTLSPGSASGQYGTLTVGNGLSLAGATIPLDLSSNPSGTNDKIVLQGGTLALSGTNMLQLNLANGVLGAGTYTLISGGSATTGTVANITNNLPTGTRQTLAIATATGAVNLNVTGTAGNLIWTGTNNSGAWDPNTTTNWTNSGTGAVFYNLDAVTFNDTSTVGTVTVTGTVDPASITVSSNTTSYTLGGSGTIGGVASLTKSGTTTLTISNTGTNTFTGGVTLNSGVLNFKLGSSLGTGTVTLNGGTLTSTGGIAFGNNFNVTAPSIWNVGGGPTYWAGALSGTAPLTLNSSGVFTPSGSWAAYSSTLSISGLVRLNQGTSMGSSAAAFNFGSSGNVYNEAAAETDVTINLGSLSGSSGSYLSGSSNAGPAVDTYVIGALNTSTTFGGIIQDGSNATPHTGALTKVGTGTLTLIGAETYSGATTVEAGTLVLAGTGSISSGSGSTVEVTSGSTLTITSTAADAITADTTLIDSGGTLTGGGTINGGVTNNGTITANSGGTFTITGDVANNGTLKLTNGTALSATGAFVNDGTLDVRQGAQTLPPNLVNNGTVLVAINLTWKGATSTAWDSATANWLNGGTGTTYGDGDYVTFADAPITSTVAISSAVSPGSLTFTNATTAYTISGAAISGTTSLVKSGAGTVTLSSANAYTGGTTINAGTISLNGANGSTAFTSALGTGTISLNGGELLLDPPGGTPGQTSSTFTNNSVLNGGILYGDDGQEHLTGTISVTAATTLLRQWNNSTADQTKGLLLDGALSGLAPLNVYGTGGTTSQGARTWIDHAGNTYSGTVTVYASGALSGFSAPLGGDSLGLGSNTALQDATVDIVGTRTSGSTDATELYGLQFGDGVTAPVLGALLGNGNINLVTFDTGSPPANLTVGGDNATTTFSGILSGAGGLTKAGTGTMTLSSGANTYAGATTVSGGVLIITGPLMTSSSVSVSSGVTLNVASGTMSTTGTIMNNGTVVLGSGVTISSTGTFTNNGTLDATNDPTFTPPGNFVNNGTVLLNNSSTPAADTPTMPPWAIVLTACLLLLSAVHSLPARRT